MKTFRIACTLFVVFAVLLIFGPMMVAAQGQIGDSPATAPFIDNQPHTIAANAGVWFKFNYDANDRSITTITLVDGNRNRVRFEVWTPDAVKDTEDNKPVGKGTAPNVNCDTGPCQSNDLIWVGAFATGGTYYVNVVNDNNVPISVLLLIQGAGVSLGTPIPPPPALPAPTDTSAPPTAVPAPTDTSIPPTSTAAPSGAPTSAAPTSTPPPSTTGATPTNTTEPTAAASPEAIAYADDPAQAIAFDAALHNLSAKSAMWFRFDYGPISTDARPVKTILLVNGSRSGVRFEVWTPDHLNDWWDNQKPVGQGTVNNVDCETGKPSESGQCQSNDLTWIGSFNMGGTYYVRVINDNTQPATLQLTIN